VIDLTFSAEDVKYHYRCSNMISIQGNNEALENQAKVLISNLDKPKKRNNRIQKLGELWRGYEGSCRCPIGGEYKPPFDRVEPTKEAVNQFLGIYLDSNEETKITIVRALNRPEPFLSEAMVILLRALKSESVKVRINAARTVSEIGFGLESYLHEILPLKDDPIKAVQHEINNLIKYIEENENRR